MQQQQRNVTVTAPCVVCALPLWDDNVTVSPCARSWDRDQVRAAPTESSEPDAVPEHHRCWTNAHWTENGRGTTSSADAQRLQEAVFCLSLVRGNEPEQRGDSQLWSPPRSEKMGQLAAAQQRKLSQSRMSYGAADRPSRQPVDDSSSLPCHTRSYWAGGSNLPVRMCCYVHCSLWGARLAHTSDHNTLKTEVALPCGAHPAPRHTVKHPGE